MGPVSACLTVWVVVYVYAVFGGLQLLLLLQMLLLMTVLVATPIDANDAAPRLIMLLLYIIVPAYQIACLILAYIPGTRREPLRIT